MVHEIAAVLAPFAGVALLILGLRQITAASMGRISLRSFPKLKDGSSSGFTRFLLGARIASGGSAGAAASAVVSFVDAGELPDRHTPQTFAGIHIGSLASAILVALIGPSFSTLLPSFLLLIVALPARQYGAVGLSSRNDVITGGAFLLLGMDISFHLGPGLVESLPSLAMPLIAAAIAGLAVSALFRSSTGTIVLAVSLIATGILAPTTAVLVALSGIPGAGLAFHVSTVRLDRPSRVSSMTYLLLGGLSALFGLFAWFFTTLIIDVTQLSASIQVVFPVGAVLVGHLASGILALAVPGFLHRVSDRLIPTQREKDPEGDSDGLSMLKAPLPETLDAHLAITRAALGKMARTAYEMLMVVINVSQLADEAEDANERIFSLREANHTRGEQVSVSLTQCAQLRCTSLQADEIRRQQQIAGELSLIGDDCYKAARMMARSYRKNYTAHKQSADELFAYTSHILDFLRYISDTLSGRLSHADPAIASDMEQSIDRQRDKLKKRARKTLQKDRDADVKGELAFIDVVSYLEHVADRCNAIAKLVR